MKFTKKQKIANLKKGIKALRQNKRKARFRMQRSNGGRCCLCVLAHVAEDICKVPRNSFCEDVLPNIDLSEVFAIATNNNKMPQVKGIALDRLNDRGISGKACSHKAIAQMLEDEYINK